MRKQYHDSRLLSLIKEDNFGDLKRKYPHKLKEC